MPQIVAQDLVKTYFVAERRPGLLGAALGLVHRRRRDEMIGVLDLSPLLDVPVRQLSLGQKMRCELAAALLHATDILFLDEPTIGLDAVAKLAVRDFIKRLNAEYGMTVILTTHD